jgi:outer membrane protein TolC
MKRWIAAFLGLILTMGTTAGCQQKCFISEQAFNDAHRLPPGLEDGDTAALVQPSNELSAAPPTVGQPDRPPRYLSLQEAIAIALENGTSGSKNGGVNTPGIVDDSPAVVTGGSLNSQSDRVRVLALQPAISGANIEAALARYDAMSVSTMTWNTTDELLQGLSSFNNGQQATFNTSIVKALSSGGVVNTTFQTQYTLLSQPPAGAFGVINPNYTARLTFGFEQPLLRNFGGEVNQLLNRIAPITGITMPAQVSNAYNTQQSNLTAVAGQPVEGILIARLRFDEQRAEFERQMHNLLLNVEVAYWNLYTAYGRLYANEEVLRLLHKLWQETKVNVELGRPPGPDVLAQIAGQYHEFRGERTDALGNVIDAERNLRGILGIPTEDGNRLVPVTPPALAEYAPNWEAALSDALVHRPELVLARENLRFHQLALTREKNTLQPDLRLVAQYQPVGFGTTLNGSGTFVDGAGNTQVSNAFRSLSSDHFNDYTIGLNLAIPLGFRFEHASVRSARLQLAQAYYVLKDQEDRVKRTLAQQYQSVNKWYRLIEARRAERQAYGEALKTKFSLVQLGKKSIDLDLLDVERRYALAFTKEYQAIAEYNSTLARLDFARGTIMQHDNVVIAENGLTPCAQVRAVEHERERTKAFILRQAPDPLTQPGRVAADSALPGLLPIKAPAMSQETPAAFYGTPPAPGQKDSLEDGTPPSLFPEPAFKSDAARPTTAPRVENDNPSNLRTVLPETGAESSQALPPPLPQPPGGAPVLPGVPGAAPPEVLPRPSALELPPAPPIPDVINDTSVPSPPQPDASR